MLRKAAEGEETENHTSFLSPNTPVATVYRRLDDAARIPEKREEVTGNNEKTFLPDFHKKKDRLEKFYNKRAVEWDFDAIVDSAIKIKETQRRLTDTSERFIKDNPEQPTPPTAQAKLEPSKLAAKGESIS